MEKKDAENKKKKNHKMNGSDNITSPAKMKGYGLFDVPKDHGL